MLSKVLILKSVSNGVTKYGNILENQDIVPQPSDENSHQAHKEKLHANLTSYGVLHSSRSCRKVENLWKATGQKGSRPLIAISLNLHY